MTSGSGLVAQAVPTRPDRPRVADAGDSRLMDQHPKYIDPMRWSPMFLKFTEYFAGATLARPSFLARGWDMPALTTTTRPDQPAGGRQLRALHDR
jgi:hypothetical protein